MLIGNNYVHADIPFVFRLQNLKRCFEQLEVVNCRRRRLQCYFHMSTGAHNSYFKGRSMQGCIEYHRRREGRKDKAKHVFREYRSQAPKKTKVINVTFKTWKWDTAGLLFLMWIFLNVIFRTNCDLYFQRKSSNYTGKKSRVINDLRNSAQTWDESGRSLLNES